MIILLAEDEAIIAFPLEWALTMAGHEILGPVDTIEEALIAVTWSRPDLALVNLTLKGEQDGAVLAHELQALDIPTIFVATDVAQARSHRDLAIGLIRKPYDAEMIPSVVRHIDDLANGRRPAKVPPQIELFN